MFREGRSLSHSGNHCAVETLSPLRVGGDLAACYEVLAILSPLRVGGDLAVCYEVFLIAGCNVFVLTVECL